MVVIFLIFNALNFVKLGLIGYLDFYFEIFFEYYFIMEVFLVILLVVTLH